MKKFDILYRRSKTGAIVYYKVTVDEGDVDHAPLIAKESGQLGTLSPIIHPEHVHQGMNIGKSNETTPVQQAHLQAESDWKKKKDSGYKSLVDLGIVPEGLPAADGSGEKVHLNLQALLDQVLPEFNTDASGNVKPMLAKDWKR